MFFCRRRRPSKRRPPTTSCWRNPIVVFLVTFIAIGSLRFRTRTTEVAETFWHKHHRTMTITNEQVEEGTLQGRSFTKYSVKSGGKQLSMADWAKLLSKDPQVSLDLSSLMAKLSSPAVFFETPPTTKETVNTRDAEFVLVEAPRLAEFAKQANVDAFAEHFQGCDTPSCSFSSLGGDAQLIAPRPISDEAQYGHLMDFVRSADPTQVSSTWQLAAQTWLAQLETDPEPRWFSTSGLGVAYLHFRVDTRPKYYTYAPYKKID